VSGVDDGRLVARFPPCCRLAAPQVTRRTTWVQNALARAGSFLSSGSLGLERCGRLVGQYPGANRFRIRRSRTPDPQDKCAAFPVAASLPAAHPPAS
jgi:hypothetical protein